RSTTTAPDTSESTSRNASRHARSSSPRATTTVVAPSRDLENCGGVDMVAIFRGSTRIRTLLRPGRRAPRIYRTAWRSGVEAVHRVGGLDDRQRHVPHGDAARGHALLRPVVRVPVDDQIGAGGVDGLAQQVATEERVDLEAFATERVLHRREVGERDAHVGMQRLQGEVQVVGEGTRVPDERLHLGLPEVAAARARESAAEALGAGDAARLAADVDDRGVSFEDPDFRAVEQLDEGFDAVALEVVIPQ